VLGSAFIIKSFRKYHKVIPLDQVQEQINLLSLSIIDLIPANLGGKFDTITGSSGITYVLIQWHMTASQSISKSKELSGIVASLQTIAEEKLNFNKLIATSNTIQIRNATVSCFMAKVTMNRIGCIRNMYHYAMLSRCKIGVSPNDLYKYCFNNYQSGTVLSIFVSENIVELDIHGDVYAICKVDLYKGSVNREPIATLLQAKYFRHLSTLFTELIKHFKSELEAITDMTVKFVSHPRYSIQRIHTKHDLCLYIGRDSFNPIISNYTTTAPMIQYFFDMHGDKILTNAKEYYSLITKC
jgi:hypothetical protein